jgi:hypothetical protein
VVVLNTVLSAAALARDTEALALRFNNYRQFEIEKY